MLQVLPTRVLYAGRAGPLLPRPLVLALPAAATVAVLHLLITRLVRLQEGFLRLQSCSSQP